MITQVINWLYNLEGWQLTAILIVLLLAIIPILASFFGWVGSKLPKLGRRKKEQVKIVDKYWGMSRAASAFFVDLKRFNSYKSIAEVDALYFVISNNPDQFTSNLQRSGLKPVLNKEYSSGSVVWASFKGGSFVVASPKVWANEIKYLESLLNLVIKYRAERPLDGIIIDISVNDLLTEESAQELNEKASFAKEALVFIQRQSQMILPTHFLLRDCHLIPGFDILFGASANKQRLLGLFAKLDNSLLISQSNIERGLAQLCFAIDELIIPELSKSRHQNNQKENLVDFSRLLALVCERFNKFIENTFPFNSFEFSGSIRSISISGSQYDQESKTGRDLLCLSVLNNIIFNEKNLAQPLPTELVKVSSQVQFAKKRMWTVMGVSLAIMISQWAMINSMLSSATTVSRDVFNEFSLFTEKKRLGEMEVEQFYKNRASYLGTLSSYDPAMIRSFLVPPSLWSSTYEDLVKAQEVLDADLLFTPIGRALNYEINRVLNEPVEARGDSKNRAYPDFVILENTINEIDRIDNLTAIYEQLRNDNVSRNNLNFLTEELFDITAPQNYVVAIQGVKLFSKLPPINSQNLDRVSEKLQESIDLFLVDLIQRDGLVDKALDLAQLLNGDSSKATIGPNGLSVVIQIRQLISELNRLLSSGKYNWLVNDNLFQEPNFQSMLVMIEGLERLQVAGGQDFKRQVFAARKEFLSKLKAIEVPTGGKMLEFGATEITLTKDLIEVENFLSQVMGVEFLGTSTFRQFGAGFNSKQLPAVVKEYAAHQWSIDTLVELRDQLNRLDRLNFSAAPISSLEKSLSNIIRNNARQLVFESLPDFRVRSIDGQMSTLESLKAQSSSFNKNYDIVLDISFLLRNLGNPDISDVIDDKILIDSKKIIKSIVALTDSSFAYNIPKKPIQAWDGMQNLPSIVLGSADQKENEFSLLKNLRAVENVYVNMGGKAITHLRENPEFKEKDDLKSFIKILNTHDAIISYQLGNPSPSIDDLNKFLLIDLPSINVNHCNLGSPRIVDLKSDFFQELHADLEFAIRTICAVKSEREGRSELFQFFSFYEDRVSDKYPFSGTARSSDLSLDDSP